jgi:hypothetical protein
MNDLFRNLTDPHVKIGTIALSLGSFGYVLVQGLKRLTTGAATSRLPPGPPRAFLLGNLRQFPPNRFYDKFCEWQRLYGSCFRVALSHHLQLVAIDGLIKFAGDIVYLELPGVSMVVLNSYEVAQELLWKRTNSTSERKIGYMMTQM